MDAFYFLIIEIFFISLLYKSKNPYVSQFLILLSGYLPEPTLIQSITITSIILGILLIVVLCIITYRKILQYKKITLTKTMIQPLFSDEGHFNFVEIMNMEWNDIDDFKTRYNSKVNPSIYSKCFSTLNQCELIGYLCRLNLIDVKMLFSVCNPTVMSGF